MKKFFTFFVLLTLIGLSGFSQLNWSNPTYYLTPTPSTNTDGILFGDFNNDSKTDMIIRHWPESTMSLLLNNGDGTFGAPSTITSNLYVNTIVLVDLNNDGFLDIATTNADGWGNPDLVSVHLGNGDGTFQPMASYSGYGQYKYSLDAGDLTGDGFKDLVVTSAGWDGFSVLVNNGDGTFTLGNNYNSTNECSPIKLADFNGDNHLDVALGNGGWGFGYQMDVFFGNGDGTFNPTFISYPTAEHPQIIVGDLDNQNGVDVVVDIPAIHASYYFKNDGAGNFTQVQIKENYDVKALCDWNNDNKIDIVAFGWDTTNSVSSGTYVILNNGNDIFSEPILIDSTYTGYISKLNNDSLFDFAYINMAQQAVGVKLQIYCNLTTTISSNGTTAVCQGDSVVLSSSNQSSPYTFQWFLNNSPISGEINNSYTATANGDYSLIVDSLGCVDTSNVINVTVNSLPTVSINSIPSFINYYATPLTLSGIPSGGNFSGNGITATSFDPNIAGLGTQTIIYNYTDVNNCNNSAFISTIVYDTTGILCTSYDTVTVNIYDTTYVTVSDTNYVTINDTVYISVTDTLIINTVLTGVAPPNNLNTFKIYPNPASTHIYIDNGDYISMNGYSIRIDNSISQTVFISLVDQQIFYIDLSSWTGIGLYFVYIIDDFGNTLDTRKIIIE